jgi:hypothetical protein
MNTQRVGDGVTVGSVVGRAVVVGAVFSAGGDGVTLDGGEDRVGCSIITRVGLGFVALRSTPAKPTAATNAAITINAGYR